MGKITKEVCVELISCFARENQLNKDKTPVEIFNSTGYSKYYKDIVFEEILKFIEKDIQIIEDWIAFSQDKRWAPAWGISNVKKNLWKIYYVKRDGLAHEFFFNNPVNACSFMIILEMESFRLKTP